MSSGHFGSPVVHLCDAAPHASSEPLGMAMACARALSTHTLLQLLARSSLCVLFATPLGKAKALVPTLNTRALVA